jgi:hypothetical protein
VTGYDCNLQPANYIPQFFSGGIAQLVERQLCKLEVRGSNPLASSLRLERSEKQGCHAGAKRRRALFPQVHVSALQDYGLAGQPSSLIMLLDERILLRLHPRQRN